MAFWAKLMFWATAVTAGITFVGVILLVRTLHHTRRAADYAKDMVDEAKATTKAAFEANANTLKAIEHEQVNAQRQLRAYMSIHSAHLRKYKAGRRGQVVVEFMNTGQTPAKDVRAVIEIDIISYYEDGFFDADIRQAKSKSSIGKDAKLTLSIMSSHVLTSEQFSGLVAREKGIFVACHVTYNDIFGKPWFIKARLVNAEEGYTGREDWVSMQVCGEGNEST